jgi:16S rRNA (cytosine967-C5)-methyltransferase
VSTLPQFAAGTFYIEDEAAQLVPLLLGPRPGERVLDACAAPGGKTTHLAALMCNSGEIVALDRNPARLRLIAENCRRLGVRNVVTGLVDLLRALPSAAGSGAGGRLPSPCARPFDRVLLDAPCTGLGVLRRHPEGKWQKREEQILAHQRVQRDLLDRVSRLLRPGGIIVYSTCSTEPEETEQVIESFCQGHPAFRRESVEPWLPPTGRACLTAQGALSTMPTPPACGSMDGFYAARLRKADR